MGKTDRLKKIMKKVIDKNSLFIFSKKEGNQINLINEYKQN